jgi:hypothetical protein
MDKVRALIERGEEAAREGRTVTHEEAKRRFARWLDIDCERLQRGEGAPVANREELMALIRNKHEPNKKGRL